MDMIFKKITISLFVFRVLKKEEKKEEKKTALSFVAAGVAFDLYQKERIGSRILIQTITSELGAPPSGQYFCNVVTGEYYADLET